MTARSWREAWVRLTKRGWAMRYRRLNRASAASIIILCSFVTTNWVTPAWTPPDIYLLESTVSPRTDSPRDRYPSSRLPPSPGSTCVNRGGIDRGWASDRSFSPRSNVKNGTTVTRRLDSIRFVRRRRITLVYVLSRWEILLKIIRKRNYFEIFVEIGIWSGFNEFRGISDDCMKQVIHFIEREIYKNGCNKYLLLFQINRAHTLLR